VLYLFFFGQIMVAISVHHLWIVDSLEGMLTTVARNTRKHTFHAHTLVCSRSSRHFALPLPHFSTLRHRSTP
jgi:hypothetical protein